MVFISYKSEEYEVASKIKDLLETRNYPCWMAPESIPAGSNYMLEIPKAIRTCDLFVLIISEASQKSQWVQKEIDRAVKFEKYILPFHADDSELSDAIDFVISNNQRIEAYHNFETACEELLAAVKMHHPEVKIPEPVVEISAYSEPQPAVQSEALAASGLSPELLMKLLESLPPDYLAKLVPGYCAPVEQQTNVAPVQTIEAVPAEEIVQGCEATTTQEESPEIESVQEEVIHQDMEVLQEAETAQAVEAVQKDPDVKAVATQIHAPTSLSSFQKDWCAELPESVRVSLSKEEREEYQRLMSFRAEYERTYPQTNEKGFRRSNFLLFDYKPAKSENGQVVIPFGIKTIGAGVFANKSSVRKVVIPPTVRLIEQDAFAGCDQLEQIVFCEGVEEIMQNAFKGCSSLEQLSLPQSLKVIGDFAFLDCMKAQIVIGVGIERIGKAALNHCREICVVPEQARYYVVTGCIIDRQNKSIISSAEHAQMPMKDGIKRIGESAFEGNRSIEALIVPKEVDFIDQRAFCGCSALESVTVPGGLHTIGEQAFADCQNLKSVHISSGVYNVLDQAFLHCRKLSVFEWPAIVKRVCANAFEGCSKMKRKQIPNNRE